jgi:hypothetical protein
MFFTLKIRFCYVTPWTFVEIYRRFRGAYCLHHQSNLIVVHGGLMVSMFVIGPKFRGFKPGQGGLILMAIKIRSKTSFGRQVKPSVPRRKIFTACYGLEFCQRSISFILRRGF